MPWHLLAKAVGGVTFMAARWRAWLEAQRAASPTKVPPLRPHEAKGGRAEFSSHLKLPICTKR